MNKNTFLSGVITALVYPIIGLVFWLFVNYVLRIANVQTIHHEVFQFTEKTIVLIAICFNLIPIHRARNRRWGEMIRGLSMVTMAMMIGWAFYYKVIPV